MLTHRNRCASRRERPHVKVQAKRPCDGYGDNNGARRLRVCYPRTSGKPWSIVEGQQLVDSIAYNIKCEIQDSVYKIYNNPDHPRKSTFLDTWGAQTTLSLQVEEKSTLNPTANWIPPNPATALFNLLFGYSEARYWAMH